MEKQKMVWKKNRYGEYYKKTIGKEIPIQTSDKNSKKARIGWREQHKRRENGYNEYYCEIYVYPTNQKNWRSYLKRIKDFKKEINSLGNVPTEEDSMVTIIKYTVKLVNAVTQFRDEGMLYTIPTEKAKETKAFHDAIINISCREKSITTSWKSTTSGQEMKKVLQYWNKSKKGEPVTYNNMYLGMYSRILQGGDTSEITTATIEKESYKVDVIMATITDWINRKVKDSYDNNNHERKIALTETNTKLKKSLLEAIDCVIG